MKRPHATPATSGEHLLFTVLISVAVHAVIILGVAFTHEPQPPAAPPALDIVLTHRGTDSAPEDPDFLPPANQDGAGNTSERVRPVNPPAAPAGEPLPGTGQRLRAQHTPSPPTPRKETPALSTERPADFHTTLNPPVDTPAKTASAAELIRRSRELARLSTELDEPVLVHTREPRHRFISARTRSFRDAVYLEAWRQKVERIGNLNYPEEAKRRGLSGSLILDVALNPDGTLHSIEIRRSSGHKILDDAAVRIVKLAAPFAPLPPDMRRDTDILHITRAWQFLGNNRFISGHY